MARENKIIAIRTTRANLNAQAAANNLNQGESYWITDEKVLAVGDSISTYTVIGAGTGASGGGTSFTTGVGLVLDSNNVLRIDDTKVARKDVAQTFSGEQTFSDRIYTPELRSLGGEGSLSIYGGYLELSSEYGIQLGNGNSQVTVFDTMNLNSDVYYRGQALEDNFLGRFSIYQDLTASFTLAAYMSERTTRLTSASASTITIPTNANANIEIGARFVFQRGSTGSVTFVPQSGVTITTPNGTSAIPEQYGTAYVVKTNTNAWSVVPAVPFNSPAFMGTPTAPTAASGDNSNTLATTAHVKSAISAAFVPREITYEMFHPNHGGITQFYHARVAETVQVSPIYGGIGYSTTSAFGTGTPAWSSVTYINAGQQASVNIAAGGTLRIELNGDAQGIPRWCHVRRTAGG